MLCETNELKTNGKVTFVAKDLFFFSVFLQIQISVLKQSLFLIMAQTSLSIL